MSQKKASGPVVKKPAAPAAKAPAAKAPAPKAAAGAPAADAPVKTVAFDQERLEAFVLGRITLGEMEGIGKDTQYEMAKKGYKMIAEGKLDHAYNIFRGLLALDPFDSYFHTALGGVQQRQGKYQEAEDSYGRALQFNPYNATALANRGEVRFQQGKVLEAAQDIKDAIANDPDGKNPATVRARVLSMAIAEVIRENQQAIMDELKKAAESSKAQAPAKAGAKPAGKAAKPAGKAPAKPAGKPVPAKKK